MSRAVRLTKDEDPTVFAKCLACDTRGRGVPVGNAYHRAYPVNKWSRGPLCENCGGPMTKLYEVSISD